LPKFIDIGFSNTGIEILPDASTPTLFPTVVKPNPVKVTLLSKAIVSLPKVEVISCPVTSTCSFTDASITTLLISVVKPNPVKVTLLSKAIVSLPKVEVIS
jgi:hypothetical protein